jgi:hypothetical protein
MTRLEGMRAEFSNHDAFLQLLLGLVSLSRRFERHLPEAPQGLPVMPSALAEEEERKVLLLLGLISVQRTLKARLEPMRAPTPALALTDPPSPPAYPQELLELLR